MLHGDLVVTIVPECKTVPQHLTKFRWGMNVALPYPFPSRKCLVRNVTVAEKPFSFQIHNHYDRIIQTIRAQKTGAPWIQAFLHDKRQPAPPRPPNCVSTIKQSLQSVAWFDGQTDYSSPSEAFAGAGATIGNCLDWLASFLAACQRDAPYLVAGQIYPVSLFDVGTVHHEVRAWCTVHNQWHLHSCAILSDLGRQRQQSSFFLEPPTELDSASPIDTTNELLAEGLMALYRGTPRLTVLNSYAALESLANVVYLQTRVAQLVLNNVPREYAEELVDNERRQHRTDGAFLYHKGLKAAAGRSLMEENKAQYEEVLKAQQLRHRVAHTGHKPTLDEARTTHKLCCEAVQWVAGVGGFPIKLLLPDASASSGRLVAGILGGCLQFGTSPAPAKKATTDSPEDATLEEKKA